MTLTDERKYPNTIGSGLGLFLKLWRHPMLYCEFFLKRFEMKRLNWFFVFVQELFSEVGDLKRHGVHYDKSGRSKGTAEVVFSRRSDASAAFKRYNNVALDGKPMKIEIVVTNVETPAIMPLVANGMYGHPNVIPRGQPRARASSRLTGGGGRGNYVGGGNNNFGGGRGAGRGRGRGRGRSDQVVSATDLDADLEKYHAESMQLN
ncbi:hypothetical protein ACHQM5_008105 [Ranunculus cassubicifolius]